MNAALAPDAEPSLEAVRARAARMLAWACLPLVACATGAALMAGNMVLPVVLLGCGFAGIAGLGAWIGGGGGRILVATGLIGQAIAITAAFSGHPWQMDSHMVFFALLAATLGLADARAVLVASAGIALHHLGLTLVLPALVYPSADLVANLNRTILHAVVVLVETIALCAAIRVRNRLDQAHAERGRGLAQAMRETEAAAREAELARDAAREARDRAQADHAAAEGARARAESEARRAQQADATAREAEEARRTELARLDAEWAEVVSIVSPALGRLAERNLECRIEERLPGHHDHLRRDFNATVQALRAAVGQVSEEARDLTRAGTTMREMALDLAERTDAQTVTIKETTAAIGEISGEVGVVAEAARRAEGLMVEVSTAAARAGTIVGEAASSMTDLRDTAARIQTIVRTIDDIAFQTNLLSLNAGIEAARAGEAGRGFAVVASEVGALSRRSADAARQITELAGHSGGRVLEGVEQVAGSVDALDEIQDLIARMLAIVTEIAGTTGTQSVRLTGMNGAMQRLDRIGLTNADSARQSVSAANAIGNHAERLAKVVDSFGIGSGELEPFIDDAPDGSEDIDVSAA